MNKWEILAKHHDMILVGFRNTLILSACRRFVAFLLSAAIVLAIQTRRGIVSRSCAHSWTACACCPS